MTYQRSIRRPDRTSSVGRRLRLAGVASSACALALALAFAISACASPATGSDPTSTAPTAAASAAPTPMPTGSADPTSSELSSTVATVSANTATTQELIAALEAAGVTNADRWAREVMEYRPYDTSDPTLQHLQDELAKYNPDPATLAAILSVLTP